MLALDAAAVTGPVGGGHPDNGRVLSAPITLTDCRSAQTSARARTTPAPRGRAVPHTGTAWARVAVSLLEVS